MVLLVLCAKLLTFPQYATNLNFVTENKDVSVPTTIIIHPELILWFDIMAQILIQDMGKLPDQEKRTCRLWKCDA